MTKKSKEPTNQEIDNSEEVTNKYGYSSICAECGAYFIIDSDCSTDVFCSDICNAKYVLDADTFDEIYSSK